MKRTLLTTVTAIFLLSAVLFIGFGCSQDSSTGPADGIVAGDVSPTVNSKPIPEITFVETFDNPKIEGNWSYFGDPHNRVEILEHDGGNPGGFLHATCDGLSCLDTYAPKLHNEVGDASIFTGDYRAKGVSRLGVDLATFGPDILTWLGRPLSLMLRYDGGTPLDYSDDVQVFYKGNVNIPSPSGSFRQYKFKVPSQSTILPDGWKVMYGYNTGDDDADWNTVIANVSMVTFFYGDPEYFFMFQQWELGVDNVSITYAE